MGRLAGPQGSHRVRQRLLCLQHAQGPQHGSGRRHLRRVRLRQRGYLHHRKAVPARRQTRDRQRLARLYHPGGINLDALKQVKEAERASLARYAELCKDAKYIPAKEYPKDQHPVWNVPCKLAFPSATQNEVSGADAANLIKNGCVLVCEGANMPSTPEAVEAFLQAGLAFGPGKCANAGGVSTSQLEMAQNASMQSWTFEEVDAKLKNIMANIFKAAHETAEEFGVPGNYVLGGNIAGFRKVADSMIEQGLY